MSRKYTPATFQPTVRPDWAGILSYIPNDEKAQMFEAILKYPSIQIQSKYWIDTIEPDLRLQYESFIEICNAKSRGVRNRWEKQKGIDIYNTSITDVQHKNNISNTDVIDSKGIEKEEDKSIDKVNKNITIPEYLLRTDSYEELSTDEIYYYDHKDLRPLLTQYWSGKTDLYNEIGEVYVRLLEERMKIKPKSNKFIAPTKEEVLEYSRERGCTDQTAQKFFDYYNVQGWKDSKGSPVKNWKGKFIGVWDKPENHEKIDQDKLLPGETMEQYGIRQRKREGQAEPIIVRGELRRTLND